VITDFRLAPANVHDLEAAEDIFEGMQGRALGDRNYWSAHLNEQGLQQVLIWLTPFKSTKREKKPFGSANIQVLAPLLKQAEKAPK
jgi:hypothetical protein